MKASEIINVIEKTALLSAAADWDASGVQVASLQKSVSHVAVMLDPALETMRRAVEAGADFILSHHPLSMQPRFPNRNDEYLHILSFLLSREVWLYSAHTSLDANPDGPVRWLAHELGLRFLAILEPAGAACSGPPAFGFGFAGVFDEPLSYAEFCRTLASILGRAEWLVCGPEPRLVRKVACCPGSGGGMLQAAVAAGADVFITGDVKYHTALEAGTANIRVLDVGHFILEEEMMRRFAVQLAQELVLPVRFFPAQDPLRLERSLF